LEEFLSTDTLTQLNRNIRAYLLDPVADSGELKA